MLLINSQKSICMDSHILQIEIDNKLSQDISIIKERILETLPQKPDAIFLCGGYGRGEGAWLRNEKGEVIPYNDYDLAIVSESNYSQDIINALRKDLAQLVDIHWVDIDCVTISRLEKLEATIHNIDFLYASKVIYGDPSILNIAPRIKPEDIGLYDLKVLNEIRIWTLLGSWEGPFHGLNKEESIFFRNQMAKCVLACCDMILVKERLYQTSYAGRVKLINELYHGDDKICKLSQWALNEKLHPSDKRLNKEDMELLYCEVYQLFIFARKQSLGFKAKLLNNPRLVRLFYYFFTDYIRNIASLLFHRKTPRLLIKQLDVFCAQNYILMAWRAGRNQNRNYTKTAARILNKWGYIEKGVYTWDELHCLVANARNNI